MMRNSLYILFALPLAHCAVCPGGYKQMSGGDCYKVKTYYDLHIGQYIPKSFDDAENDCNMDNGGLLASIHSDQENEAIWSVGGCDQMYSNIGLRCKGRDCKWDDGSPLNYERFSGNGPADDGKSRCYTISADSLNNTWQERNCGQNERDCWVCRVKARTIDCAEGEREYKGGCVYVYSPSADQKIEEPSCPGGRLVSIHSYNDDDFYEKVALDAGVTGTITIGGQFTNGVFQWNDDSIYNYKAWAYGFPNTIFGTCVQMLLESEFGGQGTWTNIECSDKQPYLCIRDGSAPDPTDIPQAKAEAQCPKIQYYSGTGSIYSPNYPLSIPGQQNCEYVIGTVEGSLVHHISFFELFLKKKQIMLNTIQASVKFVSYNCQSGTTLAFFDGLNSNEPYKTFTTDFPELNKYYFSTSNVLKIVFSANGTELPIGTGWEAEFTGILP